MNKNTLIKESEIHLIIEKSKIEGLDIKSFNNDNLKNILELKYYDFLCDIKKILDDNINYEDLLQFFLNNKIIPITNYLYDNHLDITVVNKFYELEDNLNYHIDTVKEYKKIIIINV
jgi:hypothetical protein